ncbi:flavin reductase family protein [Bradyrhizobium sp.]|uniref:flavin reductase family protein n=1 Tax=Bradyrhizobium sp. TaxID=376 RepID=UPI00341CEEB7
MDALAVLDCEVVQERRVGQHSAFFCEVKNVRLQPSRRPLVHFDRAFYAVQPVQ